ncbi:MAG TPA: hypothetical protein VH373_06100 [Jatrophihabitantaceae bacterium]|jgi:hypothetical protein
MMLARIGDDVLTFIGVYDPGNRWASFWGGFGGCLSELAIVGLVWRKINCHAKGCLRVGLHHVDGTPYTTCKKHHPVHPGSRAVTADQIARAHAAAHAAAEAELAGASSGRRRSADPR